MDWNIIDLPVKDIYGKLDIGFTPIFKESMKIFKEMGYKRILDVGCGYGKHSIYLSENNFTVTSIDINEKAIEWLKEYLNTKGISNVNLIKANANALPFENDYLMLLSVHL